MKLTGCHLSQVCGRNMGRSVMFRYEEDMDKSRLPWGLAGETRRQRSIQISVN